MKKPNVGSLYLASVFYVSGAANPRNVTFVSYFDSDRDTRVAVLVLSARKMTYGELIKSDFPTIDADGWLVRTDRGELWMNDAAQAFEKIA